MFRTISIISRLCRMSPNIHARVMSPVSINSVRFKYQNRGDGGGGDKTGRRKEPTTTTASTYDDDETDARDSMDNDGADYNLLDDK